MTNLQNGRALKVRVNDRGPFAGDRIIDLSRRAAQLLGFERAGTAPVRVRIIKDESIKVAEAAMRGDIGSYPLGAASPARSQTQYAATVPRPSGIRAAPPTGVAEASAAAPASSRPRQPRSCWPLRQGRSRSRRPVRAEPSQVASERSAMPAENSRDTPAGLAFADCLGACRHTRCRASDPPTSAIRRAARPDFHSGRDVCGRGERAIACGRASPALTGTEVVRVSVNGSRPVPGQAGAGVRARPRRGICSAKLAESGIPDARIVSD